MYSTSEYKIGYHQATENGCWFCSVRAGSTDFLRGQQAKRVSSKLCLTQNIERPQRQVNTKTHNQSQHESIYSYQSS